VEEGTPAMDRERRGRARKKAGRRREGGRKGSETDNDGGGDTRRGKGGGGGRARGASPVSFSGGAPTDDCEINWLLSAVHCHTIVITSVYVNRRVKSEFNTIINRYVTALKCTPGFKYAFTGECG